MAEKMNGESTALATIADDDCGEFGVAMAESRIRVKQLGNAVRIAREDIAAAKDPTSKALLQATLMQSLQSWIDDELLGVICNLAGTVDGFKTDKDHAGGYPKQVIKSVAICAMANGFSLIGNEINIICAGLYPTQRGYDRKLSDVEGLADFRFAIARADKDYSKTTDGGKAKGEAAFTAWATWKLNGRADRMDWRIREADGDLLDERIIVKCYESDSEDLLIGKVKKRIFERCFFVITRSELFGDIVDEDGEPLDDETFDAEFEVETEPADDETEPLDDETFDAEFEVETEPADLAAQFKALDARAEAYLIKQLPNCKNLGQVNALEAKANEFVAAESGELPEDTVEAISTNTVRKLCEARRADIRAQRGQNSNG